MPESRVSVVVAAYNRPDTLRVAVMSALAQTVPPLEVVIVGDRCDGRNGVVLSSMDGPIRYVNLPERCGEQSIPNSVGSAIARGEFVAYLNHDDVWLTHHLEVSLDCLRRTGRRWHVGAAALGLKSKSRAVGEVPLFTDRTPEGRTIARSFSRANRYVEPVSTWVVERAALESVGWWRQARRLYRTPTQDLALRLWRTAGEPSGTDEVTVLKLPKGAARRDGTARVLTYEGEEMGHEALAGLVGHSGIDGGESLRRATALTDGHTREWQSHITGDSHGAPPVAVAVVRRLAGDRTARLYLRTGFDVLNFVYRMAGTPRGVMLERILRRRTGEIGPPEQDLDTVIRWAESTSG